MNLSKFLNEINRESIDIVDSVENENGVDAGAAYLFDTKTGQRLAKILPDDGAAGDEFGRDLAISGDTIVVGARLDDDIGNSSGAAYVFVRSAGIWTQQTKLFGDDTAAFDEFGSSVSISGETVVVGAPLTDEAISASGSAYVFVRSGTTWSQQDKLLADDAEFEPEQDEQRQQHRAQRQHETRGHHAFVGEVPQGEIDNEPQPPDVRPHGTP